ncbi:hypothetical protein [Methylotuvimicrobium alcaliphilum]|uniref:hypothetical protein n=1 Tax=Methylotuvimicrobium alcaliphilum TaxID=271065 RepID=UPI00139246F8|nr:hypothetical protein [Methylotuvimicrobium alcaliphilum]
MKQLRQMWKGGSVARLTGIGGRADFCSSAIAELHGCNECRKCRSIFLPCIALIHAIHGVMQNLHSRHPWRLQIFAPRQLLSYMDVMNAENAGAFFCPASPKAPTVGALIHAIHGVMQNLHSCHPWQSDSAVKPTWTYSPST